MWLKRRCEELATFGFHQTKNALNGSVSLRERERERETETENDFEEVVLHRISILKLLKRDLVASWAADKEVELGVQRSIPRNR